MGAIGKLVDAIILAFVIFILPTLRDPEEQNLIVNLVDSINSSKVEVSANKTDAKSSIIIQLLHDGQVIIHNRVLNKVDEFENVQDFKANNSICKVNFSKENISYLGAKKVINETEVALFDILSELHVETIGFAALPKNRNSRD